MEEESWRRNDGAGIREEESWRRKAEAPKRLPESTQEAPRRHPGGTQEAPRAPRCLQEVLGGKR